MMNYSRLTVLTIAMLGLLLALPAAIEAKGPPPKVKQAIPESALQGAQDVLMTLKGDNFGPNAHIRFLLSGTNTEGLIEVEESTISFDPASGDLEFVINVDPAADPIYYDIEVEIISASGGRRGKGTDLFRVEQEGGGGPYPVDEFDIVFSGDVTGIGMGWTGGGSGQKRPPIGFWDPDSTGVYSTLDLSYFLNSVVPGPGGANCFGAQPINGAGGSVEKRRKADRAYSHISFWAYTDDGSIYVRYILHLWGRLVDRDDWLPESHNVMIMDTWRIALMDPYAGTYDDVACIGGIEEPDGFETIIDIFRVN